MKTTFALCLFILASGLYAEASFETLEKAQKAADKSGKGIFLISYAIVPGDRTNAQIQFTAAINEDEAIAANADTFELAVVNCFSLAHKDNQCVNPALAESYGWPCTVSVYAPGATKHLWRKEMSHDSTSGRKEHSKEEIADAMNEAAEKYAAFQAPIDKLNERLEADKDLKNDVQMQVDLADAWAKGFVAAKAREHYDEAIKLTKKNDKADPNIESLSWQACEAEYACEAWSLAQDSFIDFSKDFKDSDKAWQARIMAAKAQAKGGDEKGAVSALEKIVKDKKATAAHDAARAAIEELTGKKAAD
ncbi:MAG: hypothetical protein K8I27_17205 [Planctomycetes bacterium]|nr:hypothetical protein [Planctomycetota bacterium]